MKNEISGKRAHQGLRIRLNVVGVLCLLGAAPAFLPTAWLQGTIGYWARLLGDADVGPYGPLFWYGTRALSLVFLAVAWMCFVPARDPERHRDFIHAVMIALVAWVILCPVFGHGAGVPLLWHMGDSVSSLILLALFILLYPRRGAAQA